MVLCWGKPQEVSSHKGPAMQRAFACHDSVKWHLIIWSKMIQLTRLMLAWKKVCKMNSPAKRNRNDFKYTYSWVLLKGHLQLNYVIIPLFTAFVQFFGCVSGNAASSHWFRLSHVHTRKVNLLPRRCTVINLHICKICSRNIEAETKWPNGLALNRQQAIIWSNVGMLYWRIFASLSLNELRSHLLVGILHYLIIILQNC